MCNFQTYTCAKKVYTFDVLIKIYQRGQTHMMLLIFFKSFMKKVGLPSACENYAKIILFNFTQIYKRIYIFIKHTNKCKLIATKIRVLFSIGYNVKI